MSYTEKDFSGCLFNPLSKKGMLQTYPKLKEIITDDMEMANHSDMVIRYVCALYDKKSPLVLQEKDLNHRKTLAAFVAGFDENDDEDFLDKLYTSQNELCIAMTMRFLIRFMKDRLWAMIVSNEFIFWEYSRRLMKPISGAADKEELQAMDIKSKVSAELELTHKRLEAYYKEFFGDDTELEKSAKDKRWTPESVAKAQLR